MGWGKEDREAFGRRIKEARDSRGLTQAGLAEEVNAAGKQTVFAWEKGTNLPNSETLHDLAIALRADPTWLLFGEAVPATIERRTAPPTATQGLTLGRLFDELPEDLGGGQTKTALHAKLLEQLVNLLHGAPRRAPAPPDEPTSEQPQKTEKQRGGAHAK